MKLLDDYFNLCSLPCLRLCSWLSIVVVHCVKQWDMIFCSLVLVLQVDNSAQPLVVKAFVRHLAFRVTEATSILSGKFCNSFMLLAKSPSIRSLFSSMIMAQQTLIRKSKRCWSENRKSHILSTSTFGMKWETNKRIKHLSETGKHVHKHTKTNWPGSGNSCDKSNVIHRKA